MVYKYIVNSELTGFFCVDHLMDTRHFDGLSDTGATYWSIHVYNYLAHACEYYRFGGCGHIDFD